MKLSFHSTCWCPNNWLPGQQVVHYWLQYYVNFLDSVVFIHFHSSDIIQMANQISGQYRMLKIEQVELWNTVTISSSNGLTFPKYLLKNRCTSFSYKCLICTCAISRQANIDCSVDWHDWLLYGVNPQQWLKAACLVAALMTCTEGSD